MKPQFSSLIIALLAFALPGHAGASALDTVLGASAVQEEAPGIPEVRAGDLRRIGRNLGMRAGLIDGSDIIIKMIEADKARLDREYNFGSLTFASGALPPVIEDAKDVISVMEFSMTVAGRVYKIVSPSRFGQVNWRDYLYLGLSFEKDPLLNDDQRAVYPRDDKERMFWKKVVQEGYAAGRDQARQIFEVNLARLKRDFKGMRLYYELAARGLVSQPEIATATDSVANPDPNTLIIGETLIRITAQPKFQGDSAKWSVKQ